VIALARLSRSDGSHAPSRPRANPLLREQFAVWVPTWAGVLAKIWPRDAFHGRDFFMSKRQRVVARKLMFPFIALVMMSSMMAIAGGGRGNGAIVSSTPAP
jgi:hypothetical protein